MLNKIDELQKLIDEYRKANTYSSNNKSWKVPDNQIKIPIDKITKIINK